jgi:hypothetical protein
MTRTKANQEVGASTKLVPNSAAIQGVDLDRPSSSRTASARSNPASAPKESQSSNAPVLKGM